MPTIRDQAICIRHWDFSETSQTVSLYCREHGAVRGLAKGARREGGRFSGGIDLLCRGEVVAIVKPERDLATLTDWDLQEVFWNLRSSLTANRAGYYMADLVQQFFPDPAPHPAVFDALVDGLRGMDGAEPEAPMLLFQWRILVEAGVQPRLRHEGVGPTSETWGFDPGRGGVVPEHEAAPAWRVRRTTIELLQRVSAGAPITTVEAASLRRANRLLATYIREALHREPATLGLVFPDL